MYGKNIARSAKTKLSISPVLQGMHLEIWISADGRKLKQAFSSVKGKEKAKMCYKQMQHRRNVLFNLKQGWAFVVVVTIVAGLAV